ncbi:ImmA/IrrE family metallo-endopeptidase [Actinoplanes oblitus]|uniref:ImmA/IrrE family metallo-endopeptidase n=1 Tax=Actinoplanes oblitus TaxID=3040509 RepID=A0ABY8WQ23_9ACTN|nr:ImmA/IrrE family metallo-endopeptidase [Actinoplanes oblitus]WIM99969.1 ImmA/IrrE family metallo-endopeptidase [Actinoplanes oblitus]
MFTALRRCGLAVMGQDMPSLFGMYLPAMPGRNGGICLNTTMGEATIRHTAAHELGHAEFGHQRCLADGPDPFVGMPRDKWPPEEKQAEAFAAWFLMPIRLVKVALTRLGLDIARQAADVYQLSLHLGASYQGTLRHVRHLRMVDSQVAAGWGRVQPARLRSRLSGQRDQPPARVWDLSALTEGAQLRVEQGDRLIVRAPWLGGDPDFTGPAAVRMRSTPSGLAPGDGVEFDVDGAVETASLLSVTSRDGRQSWSVTLMPTPDDHRGLIAPPGTRVLVGPMSGARR